MIYIRRLSLCVFGLLLVIGCSRVSPGPTPNSPSSAESTKSDTQNKPDTEAVEVAEDDDAEFRIEIKNLLSGHKPPNANVLLQRTGSVTVPESDAWTQLLQTLNPEVEKKQAALWMIELDPLFTESGTFQADISARYRQRFYSIPPSAIRSWADKNAGSSEVSAAIMLIQIDRLFDGDQFQPVRLETALRILSEESESSPVTAGPAQDADVSVPVGEQTAEPPQASVDSPVVAQPAPVEVVPFDEAFTTDRIAWEPVMNVEITTQTAEGSKTESTAFEVKFKYDENGKQSIDKTGYKTYTWPDRQATFGPGAVIRLTQNNEVREGAIQAGEEWTWTGQLWTAKPAKPEVITGGRAKPENLPGEAVANAPRYVPVLWRKPASSDSGPLGALLNVGTMSKRDQETFDRRQARDVAILKEHLRLWDSALVALEASPKNNQALLLNLMLLDELYVDDVFQPEKSKLYLKRMAGLAPASIEQWQTALAQSKTEAVWSLVQQETIFENEMMKTPSFEKLVASLGEQTAQQAREDGLRKAEEEKARVESEAKNRAKEEAHQLDVEKAKWRTWTSTDGIHRTEAKFVTFISGMVTLEKKDGKTVKVPIDKLVEEDQQFIRERKWLK